jgi:hypothetical protein
MPKVITTTVYTFDELDDKAREKARDWWRDTEVELFDPEYVFDDAAIIAEMLGIDLQQKPVKLMNGTTRYDPTIWYSGFGNQGDGACFEGTYKYAPDALAKVKAHAPQDEKLHKIAQDLADAQKPYEGRLTANISHHDNRYHEYSMDIEVLADLDGDGMTDMGHDVAETVIEPLRDFARWIYRQMEQEYIYRMSAEHVDDNIRCNEYTFTASGKREG